MFESQPARTFYEHDVTCSNALLCCGKGGVCIRDAVHREAKVLKLFVGMTNGIATQDDPAGMGLSDELCKLTVTFYGERTELQHVA